MDCPRQGPQGQHQDTAVDHQGQAPAAAGQTAAAAAGQTAAVLLAVARGRPADRTVAPAAPLLPAAGQMDQATAVDQ